jgi:hypothetical protein
MSSRHLEGRCCVVANRILSDVDCGTRFAGAVASNEEVGSRVPLFERRWTIGRSLDYGDEYESIRTRLLEFEVAYSILLISSQTVVTWSKVLTGPKRSSLRTSKLLSGHPRDNLESPSTILNVHSGAWCVLPMVLVRLPSLLPVGPRKQARPHTTKERATVVSFLPNCTMLRRVGGSGSLPPPSRWCW